MTAISEAIDNLTQTIYLHNVNYPGVNPHSIPTQHAIYCHNVAIRGILIDWLQNDSPIEFEESVMALAKAINGDTK